jgi:hypothetical protein
VKGGDLVGLGSHRIIVMLVDVEGAALTAVVGVGRVQADDVAGALGPIVPDEEIACQLPAPRDLSVVVIGAPGVVAVDESF